MIPRRTRGAPGQEQSPLEQKYRNLLHTRFQAAGFGASADALAKLDGEIAELRARIENRKPRQKSEEPSEHDEQKAVIEWWGVQCKLWELPRKALFAIPNGQILMRSAKNPQAVMMYLRSEGFRDGVCDLMLAVPTAKYHGLFIEMKRLKGGVLSEDQAEMMEMFNELGYRAVRCNGYLEAVAEIIKYLGK